MFLYNIINLAIIFDAFNNLVKILCLANLYFLIKLEILTNIN